MSTKPLKTFSVFAVVVMVFSLLLSACAPKPTPAPQTNQPVTNGTAPTQASVQEAKTEAAPAIPEGALHIGYATETFSNPFFNTVRLFAEEEAKKSGVRLTILAADKIDAQVKNAEDLLAQKVDVLVLTPYDGQGIIPVVEKANKAGIPVICVDQKSAGGDVKTYIATDNVMGGRVAAQWLMEAIGGKGNIAILEGVPGSTSNNDRLAGFNSVLKNYPDVKVVASVTANWKRDQGLKVMSDVLTGNPNLVGVMALNDEMALGAMQAIKSANKTNQIILVGYNGADEAVQEVFKGNMNADVVQYPEEMGRLLVQWAIKIKNGENPPARINPGAGIVDTKSLNKSFRILESM